MGKPTDKTTKKFTSRMQASLLLVFCVVALLMIGLMGRLIYIMQTDGERYAKAVLSRESYVSSVIPYKRGDIVDRDGTVLAKSELQYRLILDPMRLLENEDSIEPTIKALTQNFEVEEETIRTILKDKPNSQYITVLKNLKHDAVEAFKELMSDNKSIKGVWFDEEYVRVYPNNTLACDLIGFTSTDNTGYWGIEEYYNDELNGTNGREYGYYDSELDIERIVKKPVNGNTVVSTIDADAQRIVQKHILDFNTEFGSKGIAVLIMNPNNGEILAMASNQEYDLNTPRSLEGIYSQELLAVMTEEEKTEALNKLWRNDVISNTYEPGSTFKPFTVAAALEENVVTENSTFICDGGEQIPGKEDPVRCSNRNGHGELTLTQSLMKSCNDALMQIAAGEGRNIFSRYQNSFNFGKKTGIDLPGEEAGIIRAADDISAIDLATNSFGQNFNVTMIQMAAAYSSLVNGGYYYEPHVVKQIINENGATIKEIDKVLVRQTVSAKTSDFIQEAMYQTVEAGTASGAKVEGYSIGGKTATAQKLPREAKTYIVSFMGQAPAINPEIVIYVSIDEPQNVEKQADSSIATKFASRIMKEVLPALGVYPDGEIDYMLPSDDETGTGDDSDIANPNPDQNTNEDPETGNTPADPETGNAPENNNSGETPAQNTDPSDEQDDEDPTHDEEGEPPNSYDDEFNPDVL